MDKKIFRDPSNIADYSISPFWFWNDKLEKEKLVEQLKMMERIHIKQPVIHARTYMDPECMDYLGEEWFEHISYIIEEARNGEMKVWIYDENNWPSGTANCTVTREEKNREHFLQFDIMDVTQGETICINLKEKEFLCVSVISEEFNIVNILEKNKETCIYTAEVNCKIYAVYVDVDSYDTEDGRRSVDYLSKEAIQKFLEVTHKQYQKHFSADFGKTIKGMFMDETRFCNAFPWTEGLAEEFLARKGYDIVPYLPLLIIQDRKSKYIRYDYYDVISDVCNENLFKSVYDWCNENGLLSSSHFLGEETLGTQSYFNGDMMRYFKYFHIPGVDHLGNGIGSLNIKMGTSAAYNYGRTTIACEAFGGAGWDTTMEDIICISNWLYQQGVNLLMIHGFAYSLRGERKNDWPPSYFYQWAYWDSMEQFAKMCARMSMVLTGGIPETEILIYHPIETFWKYFEPDIATKTGFFENGPWIKDEKAKEMDHGYQVLCNTLLNKNYDFTILNSDAAENFIVSSGQIVNKLTGMKYKILILPYVEVIPSQVYELAKEFQAGGGKILAYKSDLQCQVFKNGRHMIEEETARLDGVFNTDSLTEVIQFCKSNVRLPYEIVEGVGELSRSIMSYPSRLIDPYIHNGERQYGIGITSYLKENSRILNFTNYNHTDEMLSVIVESLKEPEMLVPETGEVRTVAATKINHNHYSIRIEVPKNRTVFIMCGR